MNLIRRLFYDVAFGIGIRKAAAVDSPAPFEPMYPNLFTWYADPFVFKYQGENYLFYEAYNYHEVYGKICCGRIADGKVVKTRTIIKENFHMSFPNVFEYHGQIYMLPETKQTGELRLYRCLDFPYKWELDSVLMRDVKLVDHALLFGETVLAVCYDVSSNVRKNRFFQIRMENKTAEEIFPAGDHSLERCGGTFFQIEDKTYHAIQDCKRIYGDFLKIYEVSGFAENRFDEHLILEIHGEDIRLKNNPGVNHCHTYNRNEDYEVIDFRFDKFFPNKIFRRLWPNVFLRKRQQNRHL